MAARQGAVWRFRLMAEWVDDSADPPTVLLVDGRFADRAGGDGLSKHRVGIVDHEQHSAGRRAKHSRD